jgi:molybdate transport system regulatory protein
MQHALTVRFRVDIGRRCSVGIGKIELLEGIALTGSLSQAARRMRMSYRRAWLLLADLNKSFDGPVVHTSTGGRGGGGAVLTPFGERLVAGYRKLEAKVFPLANSCLREAGRRALSTRSSEAIHPASLRRRTPAR